jgi:UTP-glucose-1-phosphate uridylyltransferase
MEEDTLKSTLVIMAAGLGSRFGKGIKQLEPVGPNGEIIMDYSIYDAMEAGVEKVVFVIRKDIEEDFRRVIGERIEKVVDVAYAYQETEDIPVAYQEKFPERVKPWGTGHAILCCKDLIDTPFLVINADDYYGKQAFHEGVAYLKEHATDAANATCMISFILKNTLSDFGTVTRGICKVDEQGMLTKIVETPNIAKQGDLAVVEHEDGKFVEVDMDSAVSMNMWGFQPEFFDVLEKEFDAFLERIPQGDAKSEFLLPIMIGELLNRKEMQVRVLQSEDKWFGVTYKEYKSSVVKAVQDLMEAGAYPRNLFGA